jgi:hypothetical protein
VGFILIGGLVGGSLLALSEDTPRKQASFAGGGEVRERGDATVEVSVVADAGGDTTEGVDWVALNNRGCCTRCWRRRGF